MRISDVSAVRDVIQFFLTKDMLNGHGGNLEITAKCYEEKDLPSGFPDVDWNRWGEIVNLPR